MKDKLVVVSGGTKGIGRALIRKFSEAGYTIATYARTASDLEKLKSEVESEFGNTVHTMPVDASNKTEVLQFGEFVKAVGLEIAVLINNAGAFEPGAVLEEEDGVLERTLNTNVASAYHLSRCLIPMMKIAGEGHVFNICSIASITAYTNGGSYCISKFALLGMSKVLREELKDSKVRVTSVLPGATLTASWAGTDLPEDRFIKADDIAEAVYSSFSLSKSTVIEEILIRPQLGDI